MSLFDAIRAAAREVAERARFVRLDDDLAAQLARELAPALREPEGDDPAHVRLASDPETLAFVVTLDAVNFGSGWFPRLRKPEGRSGYFTIASALRRHFELHGSWSAAALSGLTAAELCGVLGQDPEDGEVAELMTLFARSLCDLGRTLEARFEGSFERLVARADRRAERLVGLLAEMPFYRDVSRYDDFEVPLYKRAQITVSDLATAFGEAGPGRFDDLDQLTIFADNLVPHVLRCEGVLRYEASLAGRIEAGELLAPGSAEEVEIRAVGLHAVERMVAHLAGIASASARELDRLLWNRGQSAAIKRRNRHRTRSVFY